MTEVNYELGHPDRISTENPKLHYDFADGRNQIKGFGFPSFVLMCYHDRDWMSAEMRSVLANLISLLEPLHKTDKVNIKLFTLVILPPRLYLHRFMFC